MRSFSRERVPRSVLTREECVFVRPTREGEASAGSVGEGEGGEKDAERRWDSLARVSERVSRARASPCLEAFVSASARWYCERERKYLDLIWALVSLGDGGEYEHVLG